MREIKVKTHPNINLTVSVTDEMVKDYKDCEKQSHIIGSEKDCDKCSWNNLTINTMCMCQLDEAEELLRVAE